MSSPRTYAISGSILRVRRYPRSALPRALATAHVTKARLPQHAIRACSGWRRGGQHWHAQPRQNGGPSREDAANEQSTKREQSPWENSPYELSRREKMWRERMDRIRRMVEHDPYEALFGYSNRLLKGMRPDWWNEQNKWWQQEMSFTVKNPFAVGEAGSKPGPAKNAKDLHEGDQAAKTGDAASAKATKTTASEAEPEPELVYDPITNRMVRKSVERGMWKEHDSWTGRSNESGVKANENDHVVYAEPPTTQHQQESVARAQSQAIDIPVKPFRAPSFTMLKEDIPQEPTHSESVPNRISSARAEYEAYKAKRLSEAAKSKQWLKDEGFTHSNDVDPKTSSHGERPNMEKQFDRLHSSRQELLEDQLVDKKPWSAQRSKGTSVSGASFAQWRDRVTTRMGVYDEALADREIHDYTMQVVGDNLRNKQSVRESPRDEAASTYAPLVHPAPDVSADKAVLDYTRQVASDNIKTKRSADRARERQQTDDWLAEIRREQFKRFNQGTRDLAEWRRQTLALRRPAVESLDRVKLMIREAKDDLAKIEHVETVMTPPTGAERRSITAKALETSLQRHQDKSNDDQNFPLKTSLQRLSKDTATDSVGSQNATEAEANSGQVRTHDPVGYNHARESARLRQLSSEPKKPSKVPSLAEMIGYTKKAHEQKSKSSENSEVDATSNLLQGEVDAQKSAFTSFESSRTPVSIVADEKPVQEQTFIEEGGMSITQRVVKELEQKKKDAALVRQIRQIYEDKYGLITTSHTQPLDTYKPAEEASNAQVASISKEGSVTSPERASADTSPVTENTQHTKVAQDGNARQSSQASDKAVVVTESKPAATLKAPAPAKTAKYTILAYDSKSKTMTTASFVSIPSTTESGIPATIALRHLAYANRFLPKLIELQHRGFVPVHAERNLLILRQDSGKTGTATASADKAFDPNEPAVKNETPAEDVDATPSRIAKEPKRLEPVFSGAHSAQSADKAWRRDNEARRQARHVRRKRFRRTFRIVAGSIVLTGAVIYLAGVAVEAGGPNRGRGEMVRIPRSDEWRKRREGSPNADDAGAQSQEKR